MDDNQNNYYEGNEDWLNSDTISILVTNYENKRNKVSLENHIVTLICQVIKMIGLAASCEVMKLPVSAAIVTTLLLIQ